MGYESKSEDLRVKTTYRGHRVGSNGSSTFIDTFNAYTGGSLLTRERWAEPGHFQRVKRGELLPLNYYNVLKTSGTASGSYVIRHTVNNVTYTTTYDPMNPICGSWYDPEVGDKLLMAATNTGIDGVELCQAAAAKIYSSGWDALTFAAELQQVFDMFTMICTKWAGFVSKSRRGVTYVGVSVDQYLAYRYGMKPLLADIEAFTALVNGIDDSRKRYRDAAYQKVETSNTTLEPFIWTASTGTMSISEANKISFVGTVVADIEVPRIQLNPFITAWELVKYSFVIDWFVQVGQWLASMSFLALSTKHYASHGCLAEYTRSVALVSATSRAPYTLLGMSGATTSTSTLRYRVPCEIPLMIQAHAKLNVTRVLDALALIRQAFR